MAANAAWALRGAFLYGGDSLQLLVCNRAMSGGVTQVFAPNLFADTVAIITGAAFCAAAHVLCRLPTPLHAATHLQVVAAESVSASPRHLLHSARMLCSSVAVRTSSPTLQQRSGSALTRSVPNYTAVYPY